MNPAKTVPPDRIPPFTQLVACLGTDADDRRHRWDLLRQALEQAEEPDDNERRNELGARIQGHVVIAAKNLEAALSLCQTYLKERTQ